MPCFFLAVPQTALGRLKLQVWSDRQSTPVRSAPATDQEVGAAGPERWARTWLPSLQSPGTGGQNGSERAGAAGSVWQVFFQERHGEPWAHVGAAAPRPHRPHDLSCKANEERSLSGERQKKTAPGKGADSETGEGGEWRGRRGEGPGVRQGRDRAPPSTPGTPPTARATTGRADGAP